MKRGNHPIRRKRRSHSTARASDKPRRNANAGTTSHSTIADKLRTSRNKMRILEAGHQKNVRKEVAEQYGLALILRNDEDEWKLFISDDEWPDDRHRPKLDQRQDALRYALRLGIGLA